MVCIWVLKYENMYYMYMGVEELNMYRYMGVKVCILVLVNGRRMCTCIRILS